MRSILRKRHADTLRRRAGRVASCPGRRSQGISHGTMSKHDVCDLHEPRYCRTCIWNGSGRLLKCAEICNSTSLADVHRAEIPCIQNCLRGGTDVFGDINRNDPLDRFKSGNFNSFKVVTQIARFPEIIDSAQKVLAGIELFKWCW